MEECAKIVNTRHALQSYYYHSLTSTYHCLRVCPSELVRVLCQHPPHLAVHSWPESCQHINQLGRHRLTIHFALLLSTCTSRHSLQRYNKFRSLLPESKLISESEEVKDIVDKNRNLSTVEPQRKTCAAKRLLRSHRVKGLTGTAEAFVLEWLVLKYGTPECRLRPGTNEK